MRLWIVRDKSGLLNLHKEKPTLNEGYWLSNGFWAALDSEYFPEVVFENSPQEIELKLIEK